ncbi:MAG: DUF4282 domain-containing protein [Candidatus Thermoplasmatota archaeon]|jgi:hypothetical protein|nr:DUF4282 domain-containing protein [Candidatus Thermoplasmatota archaeon]
MAKKRTFGNFFSFRWMITPDLIKVIYVLELILFNLMNIALSLSVIAAIIILWDYTGLETLWMIVSIVVWIILRLIWWVISNILLRMFFELVILPFSIHEMVSTVEGELKDINKKVVKPEEKKEEKEKENED